MLSAGVRSTTSELQLAQHGNQSFGRKHLAVMTEYPTTMSFVSA
jgi:hypothetical protein